MTSMLECPLQFDDVLFVVWVCFPKLVEDGCLFQAGFVPVTNQSAIAESMRKEDLHRLLRTDNLDCNLLAYFVRFTGQDSSANHIRKHAFPKGREDLVLSTIQLLTQDDLVISFRIGS